jgi:cell division protease FtsH
MMGNKQQFTLWYFLGMVVLLFAVQTYFSAAHVEALPYSDFKALLQAGKVKDIKVGSEIIEGTVDLVGAEKILPAQVLAEMRQQQVIEQVGATPAAVKPGPTQAEAAKPEAAKPEVSKPSQGTLHRFTARRVEDPQLTAHLDAAKVRYTAATENRWLSTLLSWVLPTVIFVAIWQLMMRRSMGGGMGSMMQVGQSKAKVFVQSQTGVRFADVAGIDEAKEDPAARSGSRPGVEFGAGDGASRRRSFWLWRLAIPQAIRVRA